MKKWKEYSKPEQAMLITIGILTPVDFYLPLTG